MAAQKLWHKVALILGGLLTFELGTRIVAPGLNGQALDNYLRGGGGPALLKLYDWLGGGALSKGGVLALGIVPYLSARLWIWLARSINPSIDALNESAEGRRKLTRWTRYVTIGEALAQSYAFAHFMQKAPGVVAHPGIGFIAQTMVVLTAGSIIAMAVSERIARIDDDDELIEPPTDDPILLVGEGEAAAVHVPAGERVSTQ